MNQSTERADRACLLIFNKILPLVNFKYGNKDRLNKKMIRKPF